MREQFSFQTAPFDVGGDGQRAGQPGRWFRRGNRIIVLLDGSPVSDYGHLAHVHEDVGFEGEIPWLRGIAQSVGAPISIPTPRRSAETLAFRIPESPYSDEAFKLIEHGLDVLELTHISMTVFGVELATLLELGVEALAPLASFVGLLFMLGAPIAESRAIVGREKLTTGFSQGVVVGAHGRKWSTAKSLFWVKDPELMGYTFDYPEANKIAQKSYNLGLGSGFLQGQEVAKNPAKKHFFWDSLNAALSEPEKKDFWAGDWRDWTELQWKSYYIRMGTAFRTRYLRN